MPESHPNILFILVDALRVKNLSCYGYSKFTSPNIDSLAKGGVLFESAYSCTNTTDPSITTILSGKYPRSHGVINHGPRITKKELEIIWGTSLLPEMLKAYNYSTFAVDWLGRWHRRGYDFYGDYIPTVTDTLKKQVRQLRARVPKLFKIKKIQKKMKRKTAHNAKQITDTALKLLKMNYKTNFFMFIHYYDTHTPYSPPKGYAEKFYEQTNHGISVKEILDRSDDEKWRTHLARCLRNVPNVDYILAQYDGCTAFTDEQVGRLLLKVNELKILDNTLIILTSDHGESLLEHEIYLDHHGLYDVSIHVPLILYSPSLLKSKRISTFVQHVDLVPTILDMLGMGTKSLNLDGKSLLPLINGKMREIRSSIYAEESHTEKKIAVRTKDYKYIEAGSKEQAACRYCGRIHGGVRELYDLKQDPEETHNIVGERPKIENELKELLNNWIHSFRPFTEKDRIRARVKKLKYTTKV